MIINNKNVKICVSSCKSYAPKTIPVLKNSLLESGVLEDDILIVEGGHSIRTTLNANHICVTHNSFDFTSLIEILESNIVSDFWLLLHDTCRVGKDFISYIQKIDLSYEKSSLCFGLPSMSIGIYSYPYLLKHKDLILSFKNEDYTPEGLRLAKIKAIEGEDIIFKLKDVSRGYIGYCNRSQMPVDDNWYETQTPTIQEYFLQLDLYKLKKNWGQSGINPIITL